MQRPHFKLWVDVINGYIKHELLQQLVSLSPQPYLLANNIFEWVLYLELMRTASMQNEIKISHAVQKFAFSFGQLDTLTSYKQT